MEGLGAMVGGQEGCGTLFPGTDILHVVIDEIHYRCCHAGRVGDCHDSAIEESCTGRLVQAFAACSIHDRCRADGTEVKLQRRCHIECPGECGEAHQGKDKTWDETLRMLQLRLDTSDTSISSINGGSTAERMEIGVARGFG